MLGFVAHGLARGDLRNAIVSAGYLVPGLGLYVFLRAEAGPGLPPFGLIIIVIGGFVAWLIANRRYHLIHDTPTSPLRSAAQGYVEVVGTAELYPGEHTAGFASAPPSVWYQARLTWKQMGQEVSETRRSSETFLLRDDTGVCAIDPEKAEIIAVRRKRWRSGDTRYDYRYIAPGDTLYALGELRTARPADMGSNIDGDVRDILRDWKSDKAFLLQQFDADGDGQIDMAEWQAATEQARAIAESQATEAAHAPGFHVLRAPRDGRPLLVANKDPEKLARHYQLWAWFHLVMFVGATAMAGHWLTLALGGGAGA